MEHTIILTEPTVYSAAMRTMVHTELGDFVWFPYSRPCWQCDQPCSWAEMNFMTWLHPGRFMGWDKFTAYEGCEALAWDEYRLATDS